MAIMIRCKRCGRVNEVSDEAAGTTVACTGCEATLFVPGDESEGLELAAPEELVPEPPAEPAGPTECPKCGEELPPGGVICVECGFNRSTGQFILTRVGGDERDDRGVGAVARGLGTYALDLLERFKWYLTAGVVLVLVGTGVVVWTIGQRRELDRVRREDLGKGRGLGAAITELQDGTFRQLDKRRRTDPELAEPEAQRLLLEAKALHRNGQVREAISRLDRLLVTYPKMLAAREAKSLRTQWGGEAGFGGPATQPGAGPTTQGAASQPAATTQRRPAAKPARRPEPPVLHRSLAAQNKLKKARRLLRDGDVEGARKHLYELVQYFNKTESGAKAAEVLRELARTPWTPGGAASPPQATQPSTTQPVDAPGR